MKNKINLLLLLVMSVFSQKSYSQEIITIDSIYEKSEEYLLFTKIIELDSQDSPSELKNRFKNFAAQQFRNLNEVIVSETDDQIVMNFIMSYTYDGGFAGTVKVSNYYKMTTQFKTGKIRIILYDDGNTYIPPASGSPGLAAHSSHYSGYFRYKDEIKNKGLNKALYRRIYNYSALNKQFLKSIEEAMKKPIQSTETEDW